MHTNHITPDHTTPYHTIPHHTPPKAQIFQRIQIWVPFIQTLKLILTSPQGLRAASIQIFFSGSPLSFFSYQLPTLIYETQKPTPSFSFGQGRQVSAFSFQQCTTSKSYLKHKLIFLHHQQVLVYARHSNSQLLFSKPGNRPLIRLLTSPQHLRAASHKIDVHFLIVKNQKLKRIEMGGSFIQKTDIDFCDSRLHHINKLYNAKCYCLMVTFKSYFLHDPQIPNFYLANPKTGPFYHFYRPVGLRHIKKLHKTKC